MPAYKVVDLYNDLKHQIEHQEGEIKKFAEHLLQHPAGALSHSENTFHAAAEHRVMSRIIKQMMFDDSELAARAAKIAAVEMDYALQQTARPASSTSTTSNLMERYLAAASLRWAQHLKRVADSLNKERESA